MNMLILFIVLTIVNTIIQTVKSIATVKCGKTAAALINAFAYGLYTYVIIFTSAEGLNIHTKAIITALANLVGVYVVKLIEEKSRKDKLWRVEATFAHKENFIHNLKIWAEINHIAINYIDIEKYYIVNFYAPTQKDSLVIKEFVTRFNGKYFVSESKTL